MWALLASGAFLPWCVLALGLSAISVGVVAVSTPKGRRSMLVGVVTLLLVAVTATVTTAGVMRARVTVDRTEETTTDAAEAARKVVYDRTLALAKLGAALSLIAFVLGTASAIRGAVADYEAADAKGESEEWTIPLGPAVICAIALFSTVAAGTPLVMGMPKKDFPAAEKDLADAEKLLGEGKFVEGCAALDKAFQEGAAPQGLRKGTIEGLVTECFDQRIDRALSSEPGARKTELEALKASKMPLEDGQTKRLDEALAASAKEASP